MAMMQNYRRGLIFNDPSPYWSPDEARQKALQNMIQGNQESLAQDYSPTVLPKYDWAMKAAQLGSKISTINANSAINAANNAYNQAYAQQQQQQQQLNQMLGGGGGGGLGGTNPRLRAVLRALGAQESGNNYSATNPSGALGRWQVMTGNIAGPGGWDMDALGYNITPQQFLASKALQNAIVRNKFGGYLKKYGLKGALSAWYSGSPNLWNSTTPQGGYPSVHQYVLDVLRRLGMA